MKKETVKKLIENGVFQKWLNGEKIQFKMSLGNWVDINVEPLFTEDFSRYRIKQCPKYRKFKPEEFKLILDKTVVSKHNKFKCKISEVSIKNNILIIRIGYCNYNSNILLEDFTFEDGSPCGVLIEQ